MSALEMRDAALWWIGVWTTFTAADAVVLAAVLACRRRAGRRERGRTE